MFKNINKVAVLMTLADCFTWGPFIIIANLSGIYLADKLGSDVVSFIGVGTSIYFITRAAFQIPIGYITDRLDHDKDELILLALSVILMGLPFFFYPVITEAYQYYALQFIFGLGVSINLPNWRKLFALNLEKGKEGRTYAYYETAVSISSALFGTIVGYVANLGDNFFDITMRSVSVIMMLTAILVLLVFKVKTRKSNGFEDVIIEVDKVSK